MEHTQRGLTHFIHFVKHTCLFYLNCLFFLTLVSSSVIMSQQIFVYIFSVEDVWAGELARKESSAEWANGVMYSSRYYLHFPDDFFRGHVALLCFFLLTALF